MAVRKCTSIETKRKKGLNISFMHLHIFFYKTRLSIVAQEHHHHMASLIMDIIPEHPKCWKEKQENRKLPDRTPRYIIQRDREIKPKSLIHYEKSSKTSSSRHL